MLVEYRIRDRKNQGNRFLYGEYPYYSAYYADKKVALQSLWMVLKNPKFRDSETIYLEYAEYADAQKKRNDFCITRHTIWDSGFHTIEELKEMIKCVS